MYYTYTDLPVNKQNYATYVDSLRERFTIRVEVNRIINQSIDTIRIEHTAVRDTLETYLSDNVNKENYHIQRASGYHGLHYTWFTDKEDAVAFALKFNGKVV